MTLTKYHCNKCGFTKTYDVNVEPDTGYAVGYPEECPKCGGEIEPVEFGPEDIPDVGTLHDYFMDKGMSDRDAHRKAVNDVNRARAGYGLPLLK